MDNPTIIIDNKFDCDNTSMVRRVLIGPPGLNIDSLRDEFEIIYFHGFPDIRTVATSHEELSTYFDAIWPFYQRIINDGLLTVDDDLVPVDWETVKRNKGFTFNPGFGLPDTFRQNPPPYGMINQIFLSWLCKFRFFAEVPFETTDARV